MTDIINIEAYKQIREEIKTLQDPTHVASLMYRMLLLIDELHSVVEAQGEQIYKLKCRQLEVLRGAVRDEDDHGV